MYTQLYLSAKCNNQITIGLQNTRYKKEIGKSAYLTHRSVEMAMIESRRSLKMAIADYEIKAQKQRDLNEGKKPSKEYLRFMFGGAAVTLDITKKLQRILKTFRHNLLGLLALSKYVGVMIALAQYRKHRVKGFTHIQAQHVHECGAAMELLTQDPRFCHVTTLTLPANTQEAFECLAAYSGYAVNRLFQPIRRRYADMNNWFFVWEYQKRGALHLHIAHYHPDETEGMLIGNILIDEWHKILCDISDNSGIWMLSARFKNDYEMKSFYQHHTQPMRKSVAGYFSKYASKGSDTEENNYVRKFSEMYPPSRFWGCSANIKLVRKENSFDNCRDYTEEKRFMLDRFVRLHKMISACEIVLQKNYKFKKDLTPNLCVAEGFRNIYYVSKEDYQKLLNMMREEFEYF